MGSMGFYLNSSDLQVCEWAKHSATEGLPVDEDMCKQYNELVYKILNDLSADEMTGLGFALGSALAALSVDDVTGKLSFEDFAQRTGLNSIYSEETLNSLKDEVTKHFDEK